jgi:hypothetical protein
VSLLAAVGDRGWSCALGLTYLIEALSNERSFANGASLSFIFGHRLSTIPAFLLETFFGPLSGLI